ncbi:MAG: HAMP domain-containing histidine kinase [Oscillospiraceae bacterium]|nr:HAMP domain-containing histidine kinase [Oscillospiraceae bacterium]
MKTSIRNRLTALILAVCTSIIAMIGLTTTVFFKPMYHAASQSELSGILSKTIDALDDNNGVLNDAVIDEMSQFITYGVCVEISDQFGSGLVLMEGIGDACQLHGGKDTSAQSNIYMDQRRLNTVRAQELRRTVRASGSYTGDMVDNYDNQQVLRGHFWNNKYTIIVSTNLARTDAVVQIVSSQLRTVTFIAIIMALIISAVMSNWFISPIMALSKATKEITKGNYKIKIAAPEGPQDEFVQLAQDFNTMAKEIESTQEMQKELIAGISHDLRTPLTIIRGYAESIRDITGDNPQIREQQLNTIIDETDRLSKMVNSVMEYAKLSNGALKLNIVQYNIADMCMDVADIYSHKAENEGKTVVYNGPELVYVMADASLIERVLHNFVSNALLHTPPDTQVEISVFVLEGGKVRVSVKDSGDGISEEDQKHLFDKYYRSRKSSGKQGTGLGLAIVKTIMENHGFEYGVISEIGKGSEFWFVM